MERNIQREKLINLIVNAKRADPETGSFTEFLADFLIGYGVIVPDDTYELDRLRALVQADRDGRCVVLPCKVGDIVWAIRTVQDGKGTNEVHKFGEIKQISINTHGCFLVGDYFHTLSAEKIGKIAFLSHEAAEKALKGQS